MCCSGVGWLLLKKLIMDSVGVIAARGDDGDGGEVGRERWGNPSSKKMQFSIDFLCSEVIIICHLGRKGFANC